MKCALIAVTKNGAKLAEKLRHNLQSCDIYVKELFNFVYAKFIVADDFDILIYGTDKLIQVVRKTVIIINQQNHNHLPPVL